MSISALNCQQTVKILPRHCGSCIEVTYFLCGHCSGRPTHFTSTPHSCISLLQYGFFSAVLNSAHIVVTAGLAPIVAGALATGLSGYIAATNEAERYEREILREEKPLAKAPGPAATPILDLLKPYGVTEGEAALVATALHRKSKACRKFILRFKLGLQAPDPKCPLRSALTIGGSYVLCGMIPLLP